MKYDYVFKVILLGDKGTGKSTLAQRFSTNFFKSNSKITLGIEFHLKSLEINGKNVSLQVWRYCGEKPIRFISPMYFRGVDGAIFIYDITNYSSLTHIDDWLILVKREIRAEGRYPIIAVGNKIDLESKREVSREEGKQIAKTKAFKGFIECSAKTGKNVEVIFKALTRILIKKRETIVKKSKREKEEENLKKLNEQIQLNYERISKLKFPAKKINQYITLKLEHGRTFIYVNDKRFIQCIRLILNIPKSDVPLYDEVDSIDEAAKLYSNHVFQNRIVRGPLARPVPNQRHSITPEQEFWGHCSNIQAWVEHDYDTRILMSNISFPLLRELTIAGDPKAKKVYKEEIALRLESGYPSVVQYLLTQGYIQVFSPEEFETILETSNIIKKLSTELKILSQFLRSCVSRFPTLTEVILLQILRLHEGKKIFFTIIQTPPFRPYLRYNEPRFFTTLKMALENLILRVDEKIGEDIIDCIQEVNNKVEKEVYNIPNVGGRTLEAMKNLLMNNFPLNKLNEDQKLLFKHKILEQVRRTVSKCAYCGKVIPKGHDVCEWCGHKRDDDEGGFFPYPFIFKPPGGGGSMKGTIAVPVKIKS